MAWTDNVVRSGTIIDVYMPSRHYRGIFKQNIRLVVEQPNGKRFNYPIPMAMMRSYANQILGKVSASYTEMRRTFLDFAINGDFVMYVQYENITRKRSPAKQTGWCIL